jgi:predicted metal-dependent phosphoesterase TrpH
MSEPFADLHLHTCYSDGTDAPAEIVAQAAEAGLGAISITDHDTAEGIPEAIEAARPFGLEVISGVELSSEDHKKDIHVLGYGFSLDPGSPLMRCLAGMRDARVERMKKMIAKLAVMGVHGITYEEVAAQLRSNAVGRLHLARLLVEKKLVVSIEAAFQLYLGDDGAAYFPKFKQTPQEAIRLIKDSGGIAVLAHPMLTQRDELIPGFVKAGLDGLEAFYPNCSMEVANFYIRLAAKHGLLVTGGSDAHGQGKTSTWVGKAFVSQEYFQQLKERLKTV